MMSPEERSPQPVEDMNAEEDHQPPPLSNQMSPVPDPDLVESPSAAEQQNGAEEPEAMEQDISREEEEEEERKRRSPVAGDVEKFGGKIVYNPDGSAYIIEDGDMSDDESLPIPKHEGRIVDRPGEETENNEEYPQIANAFYISKSSAYYNSLYGNAYAKLIQEKKLPETPVVHSYRVYSPREKDEDRSNRDPNLSPALANFSTVPVKPILMCFVCKLSFGCSQSFGNHCTEGHSLELNEEEKSILEAKNSSAIIQKVGNREVPSVSFLEPFISNAAKSKLSPPISPGAISNMLSAANLPKVPSIPPFSTAAAALSSRSPPMNSPPAPSPLVDPSRKSPFDTMRSSAASPAATINSCSPSPVASLTSAGSYPQLPTNANMLQGTTIGACPDHVNGRPTGVECVKCDLILNQSRLSGSGWNVSRNSCKTLKCPKCNWHYKYQETLEIHMKEKHPESETTCIYCITGQQHPRLARGETYTCGYKPYRCEVCNYSTTTKGNLSIHMQSDKHLNNMQDLQNGGMAPSTSEPPTTPKAAPPTTAVNTPSRSLAQSMSSPSPLASPSKQKPNWRCDVCNYETNVARNLRIHMTSEKHTHNMMSLQQQNARNLGPLPLPPGFPTLPPTMDPQQLLQLGGLFGGVNPSAGQSEQAAMADLAYNQAVLTQLMSGGQFPGPPPDFSSLLNAAARGERNSPIPSPQDLPPHDNEPPAQPTEPNPNHLFSCCVCRDYGCDNFEDLNQHLSLDRSRTRENEVSIVIAGHYLCQLCNYKTNLKANFQLHCKTDKHLQRLSHVNHIKEGGPANDWKLRFLASLNPVELRCNACDFYTNSPHKLQVHISNQQHQVSSLLFVHLQRMESRIPENRTPSYDCALCQFHAPGKHLLMVHVRSMKHLQMEQVHQLKKRAEGNLGHTEIGDIFQVSEAQDEENDRAGSSHKSDKAVACPLCQDTFDGQDQLENHAMNTHSVNAEGLHKLQTLMNGANLFNNKNRDASPPPEKGVSDDVRDSVENEDSANGTGFNYSIEKYMDPNRPFKCEVCKESFTQKNILLVHYNSVSHLHRLKKSKAAAGEGKAKENNGSPAQATPEKTPSKGSALEALLGNLKGDRKDDDEVKPFKCNICKVAFTQGSTLDIHIRSVLHQTKASKLQELILTGQIDLSKPLIEQPDPQQLQDQHKKMINDMLSPKSCNSTGSTNSQSSPNIRSSSPDPQSSPLANLHALMGGGAKNSSSPPDGGTNSEGENMMSNLAKTFPFIPGLKQGGEREASEAGAAGGPDDKQPGSPVLKNLLQNYGMDLLKQFSDQKKQKQEQEDEEAAERNRSSTPHSDKGSSRPSSTAGPHSNMSEVQEALQKAMLQAQLQQMNPMLMQMSQMQGMNPLLAMNLHPPLIPPALLKGGQNPDLSAALKAQMQSTQQMMSGQGQPPPFMDPKLLAFMAANQQRQQDGGSGPDLKAMASMLGLPPPPQASPVTSEASPKPNLSSLQPAPPSSMESGKMNFTPPQMPDPKALLMSQQPIPNMPTPPDQGKRARTRITDEQLKILRSNFDINNSPAEDVLNMMAGQTGLPLKVIKHWFRNTLFKERQKNKDSPYNFNNPPSTKLNLEEYEKTGESKVTPLAPEEQGEYIRAEIEKMKKENEQKAEISLKSEQQPPVKIESPDLAAMNNNSEDSSNATTTNKVPKLNESSSENSLTLSRLLSSQLSQLPPLNPTSNLLPNFPAFPNVSSASGGISPLPPTAAGGKMPEYLNSLANRLSADQQQREQQRPLSPQSVSSGKRANRTRFTDYQIKVLQEFFENNAYPKDDDLEYLSKLLGLSPRVIVVWFQNARQKARKIYENQPAVDSPSPSAGSGSADEETGRFTRTAGCNYQCKKCLLVFQRYYELIRHQKQHCYKEEDAKRSALAQKAAAQAAAQYGPGSSGGPPQLMPLSEDSNSSIGGNEQARSITSPSISEKQQELSEMTKDAVNRMFGANQFLNYPPNSPFGILQQQALQQQQQMKMNQASSSQKGDNDDLGDDSDSLVSSPSSKRKLSEDGDDAAYNDSEEALAHKDKRLRTTILPEQLDFLYQKYQEDSNPSRKMLEQLAGEVGLRKRVVQVWFQNTRARERKGLYKPDENRQEAINKRCPFCPTVFKVRSALEAHLTLKHPEQPPGIIDIDALPNMAEDCSSSSELLDQQRPALPESPFPVSEHIASLMPNAAAAAAGNAMNLQDSMRKYYEDTMKRFMNDISKSSSSNGEAASSSNFLQQQQSSASLPLLPLPPADSSSNSQQIALDLTSNYDDSSDHLEDLDPNRSIETDSVNGVGGGGNKRFRTQMSGVQVKMMKAIFEVYKTPTMTECSGLGQDIGLQKRVVQVWFQNARAKEKRAKLQLQQATGSEPDGPPPPEECKTCNLKYSHKFAVQDHLFTKDHLDKLRVAIEQGRYDPESPGHAMSQTAAILQGNGQQQPGQRTNSTDSSPLQMLQMTTQVNNRELIEMSSHQNPRMLMQV